jgi:hypothetical protein
VTVSVRVERQPTATSVTTTRTTSLEMR